jgi:hypothetical protein
MTIDSGNLALLYRVSELARRYGLRPSEAAATFGYVFDEADEDFDQFKLSFENTPANPETRDKFLRMKAALGCEGNALVADLMSEIEDKVEQAIALAPRSRSL